MSQDNSSLVPSFMPQLDGLRALAVGSVAFSHWVPLHYQFGIPWGHGGVQLFFVLSGFLITGILLRCREHEAPIFAMRAFYARRFLRIFPLFYGVLVIAYVLDIKPMRETILWHVTYLSNFYFFSRQDWHGTISHFWSLAVEEQFYLFWPAVILCLPRRYTRVAVVLLIMTGVLSRILLQQLFPDTKLLSVLPNSSFDALGLGALIACGSTSERFRLLINLCKFGVPLYLMLFIVRTSGVIMPLHGVVEHLAMLGAFTWITFSASVGFKGSIRTVLEFPILLYLGKISYGLYVLHNFAAHPVRILAEGMGFPGLQHGAWGLVLKTIVTVLGASLSWHFFEAPINELKRRFPYRRRDSSTT